jgi:hypothetical protein
LLDSPIGLIFALAMAKYAFAMKYDNLQTDVVDDVLVWQHWLWVT